MHCELGRGPVSSRPLSAGAVATGDGAGRGGMGGARLKTETLKVGPLGVRWLTSSAAPVTDVAVLCHGFGAPGTDLVPLAAELVLLAPELGRRAVAFAFPEAPLSLDHLALWGGRAWWEIDMAALDAAMREGRSRDLAREEPPGLAPARRMLVALLEGLMAKTGLPLGRFILGGFSQGAMLATDVALRSDEAPAGLIAFSGTILAEETWARQMARRAGLEAVVSHGRGDPLLPFAAAEALVGMLRAAAWDVTFVPFAGGHAIPFEALAAAAKLISKATERSGGDRSNAT